MPVIRSPIRIVLLLNSVSVTSWQHEAVRQMLETGYCEIVGIVLNETRFRERLLEELGRRGLAWRLWNWSVRTLCRPVWLRKRVLPDDWLEKAARIRVRPVKAGRYAETFTENDVRRMAGLDADVFVRFGFGILKGPILGIPKHGVWSYHHDDPERIRGLPPCFWKIYRGHAWTGFFLQRLSEELDAGECILQGKVRTVPYSYFGNFNGCLAASIDLLRLAVTDLALNGRLTTLTSVSPAPEISRPPNAWQLLFFFLKCASGAVSQLVRKGLYFDHWQIVVARGEISQLLEPGTITDFETFVPVSETTGKPVRSRQAADPFIVSSAPLRIVYEDFDKGRGYGSIYLLKTDDTGNLVHDRALLEDGSHYSYPYMLRSVTGDAPRTDYLIPENAERNEVRAYAFDATTADPETGASGSNLLEGAPFTDATIIRHEGSWWLWCTRKDADSKLRLYLYQSDDWDGPYAPHPLNPVKIDITSARPAGRPFVHEGVLYRPAQNSAAHYGHALAIVRVDEITPTTYRETLHRMIAPEELPGYRSGVHHVDHAAGHIVFDKKDIRFDPSAGILRLRLKLRIKRQ